MAANTYRSEVTITVAGKDYIVRPTLDLMARFEDKFGNLLTCTMGKKIHEIYNMIGFLLENANDPCPEGQGASLAFEQGLKDMDQVVGKFISSALRVPEVEEKKDKGTEKKAGKKQA